MPSRIYLDNNATTPLEPAVVEAMSDCFLRCFANPGSRHAEGREARKALEAARETIAEILNADPKEVIFTSGGTEAGNMAVFGLAGPTPGTMLLTAGEHPATMESAKRLKRDGWKLQRLDVDSGGLFRADQYDGLPWDDVKLASVIVAHNETGVVQDLAPLIEQCHSRGVPVHVDAVQAVGKAPIDFQSLGAAALSLGAHKFHGPRGIGALLLRRDVRLKPIIFGGHQESGRRPGTEPVALAVGMAAALKRWHDDREGISEHVRSLRNRLQSGLAETCAPVVVNGSLEHRLPNTLNISFPGVDGEAMLIKLDLEGIACSLGSTCASGSAEPAPVLVAMGCPPDVYHSAVRFSVGRQNTVGEIDDAIGRIARTVGKLRESPQGSQ